MTPVKEVLVRLGKPPAEICLDWAWQLQQFETDAQSSSVWVPAAESDNDVDVFAAWSNFAVDEQGILHRRILHDRDGHDPFAGTPRDLIPPLLVQLMRWSEESRSADELGCVPRVDAKTEAVAQPLAATQSVLSTTAAPPIALKRQATPRRCQRHFPVHLYYRASIFAASGGLILFAALWWFTNRPSPSAANPPQSLASRASAATPAVVISRNSKAGEGSLSLAEPNPEFSATPGDPLGPLTLESLATDLATSVLPAEPLLSLRPSALAADSSSDSALPEPKAEGSPLLASNSLASPTAEPNIDVLGELTRLAESASVQSVEQMIPPGTTTSPAVPQSPLVLPISPSNQLQAFDKTLRLGQPVWKLRLAVGQGFTVQPEVSQQVEGRNWTSWVVQEESSKNSNQRFPSEAWTVRPTKTEVTVQAQLAKPRQTSLRWRIVASASDFPGMAIPLDRDWLDRVQTTLRQMTQILQTEVERTRLLGRVDGLPSEARSELSAHRRNLETQHKLATRWLEIVADANQLQGWLDGHFEVHAELLDSAQKPATTMLQFGNP